MMSHEVARKLSRRVVVLCALLLIVFTVFSAFTGARVASARALTAPPPGCSPVSTSNYSVFCTDPVVTKDCSGTQWWPTVDSWKKPVNYTLSDENNTCVNVIYRFSPEFSSCNINFYVPAGNIAQATFTYYWYDDASTHSGTLNENTSLAGWTTLFSSSSAWMMTFTDHAPRGTGGLPLSWGSSVAFSLEVVCHL